MTDEVFDPAITPIGHVVEVEVVYGDMIGFEWHNVVPPDECPSCGELLDPLEDVDIKNPECPVVTCPRDACGWTDENPDTKPCMPLEPPEDW